MHKVTLITKKTEVITLKTGSRGPQGIQGPKGDQGDVTLTQLNTKVDKVMATNLITNGDFSNGTTGWSGEQGTLAIINNELELTSTVDNGNVFNVSRSWSANAGDRIYFQYKITPFRTHIPAIWIGSLLRMDKTVTAGVKTTVSQVATMSSNATTIHIYGNAGSTSGNVVGAKVYFDDVLTINLTTLFGVGNEPTKEQMDYLLSVYPNSWFNGTKEIGSIQALMRATLGAQVVTPTLLNSRTGTAQYVVSKDGLVVFRGSASGGSLHTNIFVLPENIRPIATRTFPISANSAFGVVIVSVNGEVIQTVGALTNVFLDGIVFKVGV